VLIPIVLAGAWAGGIWFAVLLAVAGTIAGHEWSRLCAVERPVAQALLMVVGPVLMLALVSGGVGAGLLVLALRGLRRRSGLAWRFGLLNLARRARGSVAQLLAFGLALTVLLLLTVVRADLLDATTILDDSAIDKYVARRDIYFQRRRDLIFDGNPPRERPPGREPRSDARPPAPRSDASSSEPESSAWSGSYTEWGTIVPDAPSNDEAVISASQGMRQ